MLSWLMTTYMFLDPLAMGQLENKMEIQISPTKICGCLISKLTIIVMSHAKAKIENNYISHFGV